MKLKIKEITGAVNGALLKGAPGIEVRGFAIDSRQVKPGDLFVPFKGEKVDGHDYIQKAFANGAAGTLYAREGEPPAGLPEEGVVIAVSDSMTALQHLAAWYRRRFELPVVGVTGSSGKTTTKDYIAGVLSARFKTLKTTGNLNNEIGLPLTILQLEDFHQAAVVEMGMTAPGEITTLCEIADPSIGVITNIGEAHIELLGSIRAIAKAKAELLAYLGSGGVAVLNGDDPRLLEIGERHPGKVLYYGFNQGDIKGLEMSQRGEKSFFRARFPNGKDGWFESPLPGRESAGNARAALAVGYHLGMEMPELEAGLKAVEVTAGRLQVIRRIGEPVIIDDTYNANPASVAAAIRVLKELGGGKTVAVLGDMLELGHASGEAHRRIGRMVAETGIYCLVTVGRLAALAAEEAEKMGVIVYGYEDHEGAIKRLQEMEMDEQWHLLAKGSRGMRMEKIIEALIGEKGAKE